jgi:hypothetical protein
MTLPNRAFALAGTSQGHLDDHSKIFTCPSIFGRLSNKGIDWAIFGYNRNPLTRLDYPDTQKPTRAILGTSEISSIIENRPDLCCAGRGAAGPQREGPLRGGEPAAALASAAEISNFIRDRSAAWKSHLERLRRRRGETPGAVTATRSTRRRPPRH